MTNEELQQKIKQLEQQIKDLKVKLEEKKPYEVEVPEDLEDYYFIDAFGDVQTLYGFSKKFVHSHYQRGIAFKTREQAEQFKKEQILLLKLHKWAEEHNGGWTPNWSNFHEIKHYVTCKKEDGEFDMNFCRTFRHFIKLPYFKSKEIAKLFIDEFGEEIKEVLC